MLLERILSRENMTRAFKRVKSNKGSPGIDGMHVDELQPFLNDGWSLVKADLLDGSYRPQAVKRVEIPKPNGGKRLLGIPTVLDRLIQQAIAQELTMLYDDGFSESSFGFRPGRKAHDAVRKAQDYLNSGKKWVVDLDLEKFFDRVNHDILMSFLSERINDKRVLRLIGRYLRSGVMAGGVVSVNREGTPQGGPLSPILSNILLDELDKELEKRGHSFVRYADDCSIYVKSRRAGERIQRSISRWLCQHLRLKVNESKSGVRTVRNLTLLGFGFYWSGSGVQLRIGPKSYARFKEKVRWLTRRNWPLSIGERLSRLRSYLRGWLHYFAPAKAKDRLRVLDAWIRARIRMCLWKQWKVPQARIRNLVQLGIPRWQAYQWGHTRRGYWRTAHSPILTRSLTTGKLQEMGYYCLSAEYDRLHKT
jgi:group II intron reverse transcriptase/maturase